ncbi:hypothetical protein Q5P01_022319 [Channa striata]|uniref:Chemokine interleukin-8-like domain-containing protein n=1 Tax=Channa striata TaxID=64152 RepID=A0AA88LPN5_CHASR|nr:hypothetical protein Q5P01_022319 [Channa striata]
MFQLCVGKCADTFRPLKMSGGVKTTLMSGCAQGGIASCCRKISTTKVRRELLKNYYVQHQPACPLHVVVFTTVEGRRICSDPNEPRTKMNQSYLDKKNRGPHTTLHPHQHLQRQNS